MEFLGEHLLPGKLGHFFVVLSFASSLVAVISYFKATNAKDPAEAEGWRKMGRKAFILDVIGVYACLATIIYIIGTHKFEYNFAWEHSGRSMPMQYLLACIWEAQEGSFLLWNLWVCILGLILMRTASAHLRGRVMGLRMMVIYGLPIGLLVAGSLIDLIGFTATGTLFAVSGLLSMLAIALYWRTDLLPAHAPANAR